MTAERDARRAGTGGVRSNQATAFRSLEEGRCVGRKIVDHMASVGSTLLGLGIHRNPPAGDFGLFRVEIFGARYR